MKSFCKKRLSERTLKKTKEPSTHNCGGLEGRKKFDSEDEAFESEGQHADGPWNCSRALVLRQSEECGVCLTASPLIPSWKLGCRNSIR